MDDTAPTGRAGSLVELSARQFTVLHLLAHGYSAEQVAQLVDCRPEDVALDLTAVQLRLGEANQGAAIDRAVERDLNLIADRRPAPDGEPREG